MSGKSPSSSIPENANFLVIEHILDDEGYTSPHSSYFMSIAAALDCFAEVNHGELRYMPQSHNILLISCTFNSGENIYYVHGMFFVVLVNKFRALYETIL